MHSMCLACVTGQMELLYARGWWLLSGLQELLWLRC